MLPAAPVSRGGMHRPSRETIMTASSLLRLVIALVVLVVIVKVVLPLLFILVIVAAVGGGLYLRGASHSDRQRLLRNARRYLLG